MTAASNLEFVEDTSPSAIVNAVFVNGPTFHTSGWVVGDTTNGRHEAYVQDDTIQNAAQLYAAGQKVIGERGSRAGRGSFDLFGFTPPSLLPHPGSLLVITDANMGWASRTFAITQIDKRFAFDGSGTQDWHVTFIDIGDAPASGRSSVVRTIRRDITRFGTP